MAEKNKEKKYIELKEMINNILKEIQEIKQNQIIYMKEAQNLKDKQEQINDQINKINKRKDIKAKENNK